MRFPVAQRAVNTMALPFKKDLDKYRDMDEDELLNKLSAEELKQLETALEEIDPEVSQERGAGRGFPVAERFIDRIFVFRNSEEKEKRFFVFVSSVFAGSFFSGHFHAQ